MATPHEPSQHPSSQPPAEGAAPAPTSTPPEGSGHSHPVGVGLGAVSAGAAGAAIGAVAGPVGVVLGAVVGAVAGAILGKEAAETVNPTDPVNVAPPPRASESPAATPGAFAFPGVSGSLDRSSEANITPVSPPPPAAVGEPVDLDVPPPAPTAGMISPVTGASPMASFVGGGAGESLPATLPPPERELLRPSSRLQRISLAAPPPPPVTVTARVSYPEEGVRTAAYLRYLARTQGGEPGNEVSDWVEAEREVLRG